MANNAVRNTLNKVAGLETQRWDWTQTMPIMEMQLSFGQSWKTEGPTEMKIVHCAGLSEKKFHYMALYSHRVEKIV